MKVKNINGTSDNSCSCGSWIAHWKNYGGESIPTYCSEISCIGKDLVGAHVQKETGDNSWYIVPLCKKHNADTGVIDVGSTPLVPANKKNCTK